VIYGLAYALLLAALVVRVRPPDAAVPLRPFEPPPDEPLLLTRLHHRLFLVILLGAPLERLVVAGEPAGRTLGLVVFAAGVLLYRLAGRDLGGAVSPFLGPRAGALLVTRGLYRYVRHPMYLSEAMIAVGAPASLGSRYMLWLAVPALAVLALRVLREEDALVRTFPEYPNYAARTKRLVPFLY